MGVTAANIPNFSGKASLSLADLQALSDVVRANMLQAEQPPARVKVGVALPRPAHHVPEGGMYFGESFIAPVSSHVSRPGLVQSLEFMSGLERPAFVHGKGVLPLAATVDRYGDALPSPVAGGIASARWAEDSSVSEPRILPGGVLEIPMTTGVGGGGGVVTPPGNVEAPLAHFGGTQIDPVPGLVGGMNLSSGIDKPEAKDGQVYFPLAHCPGVPSSVSKPVGGAIYGAAYDDTLADPKVDNGLVLLPRPGNGSSAPKGFYNSDTNVKTTWEQFFAGTSPIPLSGYSAGGLRIMAFHLGGFITLYLEGSGSS